MTELLLDWFAIYGLPLMLVALVFGQMGIPMPTSILLLTVGAMLTDSVFSPISVFAMGLLGAVIGDQVGYWIGRKGGPSVIDWMHKSRWNEQVARAEAYTERYGAQGVFITRWLVSPLGPYLNYVVGMVRMPWIKFTTMSIAGEALWISLFLTLGHLFNRSISATNDLVANATWFIGAAIVATLLGRPFLRTWKKLANRRAEKRAR